MLQLLRSGDEAEAAQGGRGLREVVAQRPAAVVPYLLPKLCATPVSLVHAKALQAVAPVAGEALHNQLDAALPALLAELYVEAELRTDGKAVLPEHRDALLGAAEV